MHLSGRQSEIDAAFRRLGDADEFFVRSAEHISWQLEYATRQILNEVEGGNLATAQLSLSDLRGELRAARAELVESIDELVRYRNTFRRAALTP